MATTIRKAERTAAAIKVRGRRLYRFSLEQYHAMAQAGIFDADDRVELLEGRIVMMSPINPPHAVVVEQTLRLLLSLLPQGWTTRVQHPITLQSSEPHPDLCVVRGSVRDYERRHPGPGEIGLLIEVSDSTVAADRTRKAAIYAGEAIPCYWVINLIDRQIEVYSQPKPQSAAGQAEYLRRETHDETAVVPVVLEGQPIGEILVQDLLPTPSCPPSNNT